MTRERARYLDLLNSGELEKRVEAARQHLLNCDVCPLACGVNRLAGELGVCQTGEFAQVCSYGPHHGEERLISGRRGSGTIFFARCNLRCVYCQNADISQASVGRPLDAKELAAIMLDLQKRGCHNINLVSPSHIIPQILAGVLAAAQQGLRIPLVYNTGGYDSIAMLELLDGVVDIYMPDMKYGDEEAGRKYSLVPDYPAVNQQAVLAMHQQVGDLQLNAEGIATRGLLVRHLVLPNDIASSEKVLKFLAKKVSKEVYLNIMAQYHPAYRAGQYPELNQPLHAEDYLRVVQLAHELGLRGLDV
jgi:putative pyruvate formate lyase activating enzyme